MKAELLPLTGQLTGEENRVCVSATKTDLTDILVCVRSFRILVSFTASGHWGAPPSLLNHELNTFSL